MRQIYIFDGSFVQISFHDRQVMRVKDGKEKEGRKSNPWSLDDTSYFHAGDTILYKLLTVGTAGSYA